MAKHSNFKSFALAVNKNAKDIVDREHKKILKAMYSGLNTAVVVTPKDTGAAQNNWQIQNKLNTDVQHGLFPPNQANDFSNPIYLVNNLPYIQKLDDGSSSQAPSGMTPSIIFAISTALGKKS